MGRWRRRGGLLNLTAEQAEARKVIADLDIRPGDPAARLTSLSGGNQQKVLLARVLQVKPKVILADEPTRGVDVAAKEQVLATLRAFADNGGSVIMTSSEIEEVLSVSDRIYVIHAGRVVREITDVGPHVSIESVLASSFGHDDA
jgi:ribose transport system ATP-binding protein